MPIIVALLVFSHYEKYWGDWYNLFTWILEQYIYLNPWTKGPVISMVSGGGEATAIFPASSRDSTVNMTVCPCSSVTASIGIWLSVVSVATWMLSREGRLPAIQVSFNVPKGKNNVAYCITASIGIWLSVVSVATWMLSWEGRLPAIQVSFNVPWSQNQ